MKTIKKTLLTGITAVLAAFTFGSCSSDELVADTPNQEQQQTKTITMNVHLEATAGQEMPSGDPSSRGLQLQYKQKVPFFTLNEDDNNEKTVQATCVFKRYNPTTEALEDGTEMYGKVIFKQDPAQTTQGLKDNIKIICDGNITLTPINQDIKINPGDQWYMLGMIGGAFDEQKKTITCKGFAGEFNSNGEDFNNNLDTQQGYHIPFLSTWTKLAPVTDTKTFSNIDNIHFKAQGMLMKVLVKNDTKYNLALKLLSLQSTTLATSSVYDLSSNGLPKLDNNKYEAFKWTYEVSEETGAQKDATGKWMRRSWRFGDNGTNPSNMLLSPEKSLQHKSDNTYRTILIWTNAMKPKDSTPSRTGFYLELDNTEAKPLGAAYNSKYKYVYTSDANFDDMVAQGLIAAPNMDWVLAKVLQDDFTKKLGTFIKCPIKIKQREVLPAEQMAQDNLYNYDYNNDKPTWCKNNTKHYAQTGKWTKTYAQNSENKNNTWQLPTKEQWTGMFLTNDQNEEHTKNFDAGSYNWSEGGSATSNKAAAKENVTFGDGTTKYEYYSVYQRFPGGNPDIDKEYPNNKYVYALRFFENEAQTKGSKHFCLMKYYYSRTKDDTDKMEVKTIYLGPLFMKLYEGMYQTTEDLLKEIGHNDDDKNPESMFGNYVKTMVTRTMTLKNAPFKDFYYAASVDPLNRTFTAGYFVGPVSNFTANNAAKEISFREGRVIDGKTGKTYNNVDFSNYTSRSTDTKGYLRPINTKFMTFQYK